MGKNGCRYCEVENFSSFVEERIDGGEGGLCHLHDPDAQKDAVLFQEMLQAKISCGDYNFSGFVFPAGTAQFDSFRFNGDQVDFSGAVFLGDASFHSARFSGKTADFSGAKFQRRAKFSGATFECGAVFFSRALFSGEADFDGAQFYGETANFTDARFDGVTTFRNAEFKGCGTYFTEAAFAGEKADFSGVKFSADTLDFKWMRFSCNTDFSDSILSGGKTTFQESKFLKGVAQFERTRFLSKTTIFDGCRFSGDGCVFSGSTTGGDEISFTRAYFSGKRSLFLSIEFCCNSVRFDSIRFSAERVDFSEAIFSGGFTDFRGTIFTGRNVLFSGARFDGKTLFEHVILATERPPVFTGVAFHGPVSFQKAKFERGAEFNNAKFSSDADFAHAVFPGASESAPVNFRDAEFTGPILSLQHVNLRQTLFTDVIISSKLQSEKTKWPNRRCFLHLRGRRTCADEVQASSPEAFREASKALATLEEASRMTGAWRLAADFAFSAYECRRKTRPFYSPLRYVELIFGAWLSGYGQKTWNLALTAAIIIISFSILFFVTGEWSNITAGVGDEEIGILKALQHCGGCFLQSFVAFFTGGVLNLQFKSSLEKVLLLIEGILGLLSMSSFSVFYLLRKRLLSGISRSGK